MPIVDERLVIRPEDPAPLGCPLLTGTKAVSAKQGFCNVIEWPLRDAAGAPIDLSDLLDPASEDSQESGDADSGQVLFRFVDAVSDSTDVYQLIGWSDSPSTGKVRVQLSTDITTNAGLWRFDVVVTDKTGLPVVYGEGLLSVERTSLGTLSTPAGPPTLNEIRAKLRDYLGSNDPDGVEYTAAEILQAILQPVQEWNEALPPVPPVLTASTFPYRFNWMQAICGYLLQTAAHWSRRNKFRGSVAGIQDESRNYDQDYDRVANDLLGQWRTFVTTKKMSLNARRGFGSLGSGYSRW